MNEAEVRFRRVYSKIPCQASNCLLCPIVRSAEDLEEEWNKILPAIKQTLTARDEMDISSDTDVDSITEDGFYG